MQERSEGTLTTSASGAWSDLATCTGDDLAALITVNHAEAMERESRVLRLACAWADMHGVDDTPDIMYEALVGRGRQLGGDGTPTVGEFAPAEFGTLQRMSIVAGRMVIADALDLRHRLPRLWLLVLGGQVRVWAARQVAQQTRSLSLEAVDRLDAEISSFLPMLPWARFQRLLTATILEVDPAAAAEREERARGDRFVWMSDSDDGLKTLVAKAASGDVVWFLATVNRIAEILQTQGDRDPINVRRARAIGILAQPAVALQLLIDHRGDPVAPDQTPEPDPEPDVEREPEHRSLDLTPPAGRIDPAAVRPPVVLHFHLSDLSVVQGHGLVRPEDGGVLTLRQLQTFLADTGCAVKVQPVLDPAAVAPVDAYEIPQRIRRAVRLRNPADTFPYGTSVSPGLDLDHTVPYLAMDRGGPPGQTRPDNLGPIGRSGHRAVTLGRWKRRQPSAGVFVYRSPHGYVYLTTNQGVFDLGQNGFADAVWHADNGNVAAPTSVAA